MGMDSYLELFTSIIGWTVANVIYGVLVDTGIVFLPIAISIISIWLEAYNIGAENGAVEGAIRKMETKILCSLFVISMCFVPTSWSTLSKASLLYTPDGDVMNHNPATVTGNASGTTYDTAFADSGQAGVPVPLWWYTVMGLTSGVNSAVRTGVSQGALGLRQSEQLAQLATIQSPRLRSEAQAFRDQCFVPAHALFHRPDNPPSELAEQIFSENATGADDTEWIGSKLFQQDPKYYASFRAWQPIAGFVMRDGGDDLDAAPDATGFSMPNCKRWWATEEVGLRARLMNMSSSTLQRLSDRVWATVQASSPTSGLGRVDVDDQILKQALWRSHSNFVDTGLVVGGKNVSRWSAPELLSGLGIAEKGAEASFSYYPIVQFLTMAQPLILMGLYMFMPLIVVFSGFSLEYMIHGAMAIFTVKFWASMWAVARYVDERLVMAMYGDSTIFVREYITNGLDGGAKRGVLNALTLGLFIALPMVWSGMMAWIGFKVGEAVKGAIQSAYSTGAQAGTSAMRTTGSIVNKARGAMSSRSND